MLASFKMLSPMENSPEGIPGKVLESPRDSVAQESTMIHTNGSFRCFEQNGTIFVSKCFSEGNTSLMGGQDGFLRHMNTISSRISRVNYNCPWMFLVLASEQAAVAASKPAPLELAWQGLCQGP